MAIVNVPDIGLTLSDADSIREYMVSIGVDYERRAIVNLSPDAAEEEVLETYRNEIVSLKRKGSYVVADVIDVGPDTPGLDLMLNKFNKEHWHAENEVRFVIEGHGLFHIAQSDGDVVSIEMEAGDLICVPSGTLHWFNLCSDRRIKAIRLFQDPSGWTPYYTGSGTDSNYQPLCFGGSALIHIDLR